MAFTGVTTKELTTTNAKVDRPPVHVQHVYAAHALNNHAGMRRQLSRNSFVGWR